MLKSSPANLTLYPLVWLAVCFTAGIVTANFLSGGWQVYFIISIIFTFLTIAFIKRQSALIFLSVAFAAAGGLYFQIEIQSVAENRVKRLYDERRIASGDPIEVEGILQAQPELAVGGFFLVLKAERAVYKDSEINLTGNIRLFAPTPDDQVKNEYDQLNLNYGSRLRVACNLRREDDYLNPGVISQKLLLDQKNIDATAIIKSPLLFEKIASAKTFAPLAWIYERRHDLTINFRDNFSASTAGVLIASLLGNSYFLDKQTAEVFRAGGTFHVLVISGLHITFIGGLTLLFVQIFTNKGLWQFLIAVTFLWAYSLAVGADVPVVRATIMFTILLFSQVIYRSGTLLNALGFCALILLVWRPSDVFTPSFQLTFASVGTIVAIGFPLVEKLRAIGSWMPSAETPFSPNVPDWLKRFCETLYWREAIWERDVSRQLWSANLFKSPYLKWHGAHNLQTILRYAFEAILISIIFQICLLPLTVFYFHRFPVLSIFLNLWVGVILALESFAAVVAVLFASISSALALPVIKLTEILNWLLVSVPGFFTDYNWANWRLPVYSGARRVIYFFYFIPVIILTFALNKWNPFKLDTNYNLQIANYEFSATRNAYVWSAILLLLFTVIVFHPFSLSEPRGKLYVDFLDVGQGDAIFIRFPNGETLLVDGGGKVNFNQTKLATGDEPEMFEPDARSVGEAVVSEFLWERGYSQIDYILSTHADADHIQGLSDVAKNFSVRMAIFGRTPFEDAGFAELFSILQKRGIESFVIARGDVLTFGEVKIEVLNPPRSDLAEAASDNNHSLVLRIIYGERKFTLTGDIEKETEKELLNAPAFLQTDVIKVAHHGSRTSSIQEFISATKAKMAIVSVGRDSPYGHPHGEVVERWKTAGAKVLTTGENGTISFSTDGRDLQLKTFNKEKIYR